MSITVRWGPGYYALFRRLAVHLDGAEVGRVSHNSSLTVTGTGSDQELTVTMDWTRCEPLAVRDPGGDRTLTVRVADRPFPEALWRTFLTPSRLWRLEIEDGPGA